MPNFNSNDEDPFGSMIAFSAYAAYAQLIDSNHFIHKPRKAKEIPTHINEAQQVKLHNAHGMKQFKVNDKYVWALNLKNATRKANKLCI